MARYLYDDNRDELAQYIAEAKALNRTWYCMEKGCTGHRYGPLCRPATRW